MLSYSARENPFAARRMKKQLEVSVLPLSEHPYLYQKSERVLELREIVAHPNYLILYQVTVNQIEIVTVVYIRREFPVPL
ncbi:type II toxin-antitoxin system RelE/ParE family toxin [Bartonella henselae]|uniref:type II toxin-antitoxin system RelE/ParE family toxin n=1 Tax=Bartonella henselae TaxID=38323 RepID=UPI001AECE8DE|nr:type II toxin-antitoxin system RelE/ParE family toxin [Bartonella henselae]